MSTENETPAATGSNFVSTIVQQLYSPARETSQHDYVSLAEVLNSVREVTECDAETLYDTMVSLGYVTRTIDATIYWVVKPA